MRPKHKEKRRTKRKQANERNRMKNRIPTRFEPETRFELKPAPAASFRVAQESRFENLKNRLLLERIENAYDPELDAYLRRAANDAAALAWITPYPLLVFPALFDEKADVAIARAERQQVIRQVSRELLAV
jgi:hypothetical protein